MHKVPPQHKIELTGSHAPTRLEKKLFEKYGPLRKGLYTPVEDKIITKNWETFCQVYSYLLYFRCLSHTHTYTCIVCNIILSLY